MKTLFITTVIFSLLTSHALAQELESLATLSPQFSYVDLERAKTIFKTLGSLNGMIEGCGVYASPLDKTWLLEIAQKHGASDSYLESLSMTYESERIARGQRIPYGCPKKHVTRIEDIKITLKSNLNSCLQSSSENPFNCLYKK